MRYKEVVLRIEVEACETVVGMLRLCPQVEVLGECLITDIRKVIDACIKKAISEMRDNKAFKLPSDYTYIMLATNDNVLKDIPFFYSPKEFIDYLAALGLDGLPGRSTLYDTIAKVSGHFPDWQFHDAPKPAEVIRRNNVVKQFMSAFNRANRALSDGFSEK